jgi:hypothetical protein
LWVEEAKKMATYIEGAESLYTENQKSEILAQLDRLLENSHFSHSKRFPSFLRFITQEELEGRGDQLKERTLGMEVFGRDAAYDTTSDPIVRVTAAEIRKRIAQYYQETGHTDELRISLPAGSYVPHFSWPGAEALVSQHAAVHSPSHPVEPRANSVDSSPVVEHALPTPRPGRSRHFTGFAMTALFWICVLTGIWAWKQAHPPALDRFWGPVLSGGDSVVVCFPRTEVQTITLRSAADPEATQHFQEQMSALMVDDLEPLVSLAGLLEMRHQRYTLMGEDTATLTDLRRAPTIFVGAFDNAWTLRVTRGLRYRFGNDPDMKHFWIEDTQSTARWQIDRTQQIATNNYRDYAIVARFVDGSTGQLAVVAAGIARGGTVAAGEFLTQPGNMEKVKARAPKNWYGKNMEFVLSTEIIDGRSAPPKIEATYFW